MAYQDIPKAQYFFLIIVSLILSFTQAYADPEGENLIKNGGFESPQGWKNVWTIENIKGTSAPYFYHLTKDDHGHADASPRSGDNAIEIYSSGRVTRLSQLVDLKSGKYRISLYARNNGATHSSMLKMSLGMDMAVFPVLSYRYRPYYADFKIKKPGKYRVSFVSNNLGLALDDISLSRVTQEKPPALPYLFFDLIPTSVERSSGKQFYLKDFSQWINFGITCIDFRRLEAPVMHVYVPESVKVFGFGSEFMKKNLPMNGAGDPVIESEINRDGIKWRHIAVHLPRFFEGYTKPLVFGGFFIEVPGGGEVPMEIEIEDRSKIISSETITLIPVDPPLRHSAPKSIRTIGYMVQHRLQSLEGRLKSLPKQFALMGFNVWSDYDLTREAGEPDLNPKEKVRVKAYLDYDVREFWPNFSSLLNTRAASHYTDWSTRFNDPDMYEVNLFGRVERGYYNMHYIANKGLAWIQSSLAGWKRTLSRTREMKLPYRNTGMINNALEEIRFSYDPSTLADFAKKNGIPEGEVNRESLEMTLNKQWVEYYQDLYDKTVKIWAENMREAVPDSQLGLSLDTFGPAGSRNVLNVPEQMRWGQFVDFTMPQWYGLNYYGSAYHNRIKKGVAEKVYGKSNGGTDVYPLLLVSMGPGYQDPLALRFQVFDCLSTSNVIKGIGYYKSTYAFADGKFMAGLSRLHTLLADVEDYYIHGKKSDHLASFKSIESDKFVSAINPAGQPAHFKAKINTTVRVHRLNQSGRIALLTVISHSNQKLGETGVIHLDLAGLVDHAEGKVLIDRLNYEIRPLSDKILVNTDSSGNMALFEIAEKSWAEKEFLPVY